MRTTLDLPRELIEEALKLSHQKTKTGVIVVALENYVRRQRLAGLKRFKGTVALDVDLTTLRERK
jgi:hypothetical protein